MAALASASAFCLTSLPPLSSSYATRVTCPSSSPLKISCSHHVNPKATKKHNKNRPKKHSLSDRKRGGTKDYGPWPEPPIIFEFVMEGGEERGGEATGGQNRVVEHEKLESLLTREAVAAALKKA